MPNSKVKEKLNLGPVAETVMLTWFANGWAADRSTRPLVQDAENPASETDWLSQLADAKVMPEGFVEPGADIVHS